MKSQKVRKSDKNGNLQYLPVCVPTKAGSFTDDCYRKPVGHVQRYLRINRTINKKTKSQQMKLIFISDIHANLPALKAVLEDIEKPQS